MKRSVIRTLGQALTSNAARRRSRTAWRWARFGAKILLNLIAYGLLAALVLSAFISPVGWPLAVQWVVDTFETYGGPLTRDLLARLDVTVDTIGTAEFGAAMMGAFAAVGLAVWRSVVAVSQLRATRRTLDESVAGRREERFAKAAEQACHADRRLRLAGLDAIAALAREAPDPPANYDLRARTFLVDTFGQWLDQHASQTPPPEIAWILSALRAWPNMGNPLNQPEHELPACLEDVASQNGAPADRQRWAQALARALRQKPGEAP